MRNEIPKETSINIIRSVCSLDLFYCILRNYKEEKVVRDLLFLLIDRLVIPDRYIDNSVINCNVEILRNDANVLYDFIEVFPQKEILQLKNFTLTSVLECLRIFKFYVPLLDFNFNMISKLFELVQSEDVRIQKKTYEGLYYFSQYNKINVCLCDTLYSNEVVSSIKYPAMKYRLLFLYKVFRNKCTCFITHQEKMSRLLQTIIICMYIANNSAQKIAEEIIYDLVQDFGVEDILILLEKGIYAEDIKIKSGVLCTFSSILRDFGTKMEENIKVLFYDYMFKIYREVNALVIIKLIITYIKYTEDIVDEKVCDILNYYIDSRKKKYRKDIRDALFLMNKNEISVSKKLRRYLTFKIPTNKKILQITKKNEIIISEEKK